MVDKEEFVKKRKMTLLIASFLYLCSGTYALEGSNRCTKCEAGKACADPTQDSSVDCAPGEFAYAGSGACSECPAGWECPDVDGSNNAQCIGGQYSTGNQTDCTDCPAGMCSTHYSGLNFTLEAAHPSIAYTRPYSIAANNTLLAPYY